MGSNQRGGRHQRALYTILYGVLERVKKKMAEMGVQLAPIQKSLMVACKQAADAAKQAADQRGL